MGRIAVYFRYLNLLALLMVAFKFLAVIQDGPGWEIPSYVIEEGGQLLSIIFILLFLEFILLFLDLYFKKKMRASAWGLYIGLVLICYWLHLSEFNNFFMNLQFKLPFVSMLMTHYLFWGVPLSLVAVIYLTLQRKGTKDPLMRG
ncbi:hypothetical protein [Paenibacillus daejeonensis]|uniref:hypothetical protein n=1 Tax=Paenibacillus daejeonensis TaxID=135193 RepID=UPI00036176AB|nr:hypothetical protein [Paenibacillus daejeonensis]